MGDNPESGADELLSKAIHQLGVKWNYRDDYKNVVEDYCLTKNPAWLDDLFFLQRYLISLMCLLLGPILIGYATIFANNHFAFKTAMGVILDKEECVVTNPVPLRAMTLPPANCFSLCQGLEQLPVVENLTSDEFLTQYAYTGRPVLVRAATVNWTAKDHFSFDFFKRVFEPHAERLERWRNSGNLDWDSESKQDDTDPPISDEDSKDLDHCQFFPYKTEFENLWQFLNMSEARSRLDPSEKSYYVGWNNCFRPVIEQLRHHYSRPTFLPADSESSRVDWIFMGGSTAATGGGAPVHIDNVDRPSWQAVVSGYKTWMLYPPAECEDVCPSELTVDMQQGDVLVVDTNLWYHGTKAKRGVVTIAIGSEYD